MFEGVFMKQLFSRAFLLTGLSLSLSLAHAETRTLDHLSREGSQETVNIQSADSKLLGIKTSQYEKNGWWGLGTPAADTGFHHYDATDLAMGSDHCQTLQLDGNEFAPWREARTKCLAKGYDSIHLYVSFQRDFNDSSVDWLAANDPWARSTDKNRAAIRTLKVNSLRELLVAMAKLTAECKVVDFLFIHSHGSPGLLHFNDATAVPVATVLNSGFTPCSLSPRAKIQVMGCDVACGDAASAIRDQLQDLFSEKEYYSNAKAKPFADVKLLFNTDLGMRIDLGLPQALLRLTPLSEKINHFAFKSDNGLGIEYWIQDGAVGTDIALESVPACIKRN
jgi:hypothetical protein